MSWQPCHDGKRLQLSGLPKRYFSEELAAHSVWAPNNLKASKVGKSEFSFTSWGWCQKKQEGGNLPWKQISLGLNPPPVSISNSLDYALATSWIGGGNTMFLKKLYFQRSLSLADKSWRPSRSSVEGTDLLSCRHPAAGSHEGRQWLEGHHWAVDQHLPEVHPDPSFLIIGANRFPLLFGNKQKTKSKQIQRTAF